MGRINKKKHFDDSDDEALSKKTPAGKKAKKNDDQDADNESLNGNADKEEQDYEVQDIVDDQKIDGVVHYLIRWKGYGAADDTWEPEDTVNCPDIIAKYMKKKSQKETKKKATPSKANNATKGKKAKKDVKSDPDKEWEVEKIVDYEKDKKGENLYRIRWRGYKAKDDTWEPESNLNCKELIEKFMKRWKAQEHLSFKELREEPKKTKRLVNETAPRTNLKNPVGRSSKRATARKRVYYGDSD